MARLTDHLRSPANCSKQKHSLPDGIDDAKLKLLKARHKGQMTERQKWERMYHILFPDDDRLPTPCMPRTPASHNVHVLTIP